MPYLNGTGPFGEGPGTGRGLGSCSGITAQRPFCRGRGRFGFGFQRCWQAPTDEASALKEEKALLEARLKEIGEGLARLK